MIDDLHTTLIILHMPIVQKANHLRGYLKPSRSSVEHHVPNAQLRAVVNEEKKNTKFSRTQVSQKRPQAHHVLAVGAWRLAIGDWRLMAVGGG